MRYRHFGREIAAHDIQTKRCDVYGQGEGHRERVMLIYDGLHYDALAIAGDRMKVCPIWQIHYSTQAGKTRSVTSLAVSPAMAIDLHMSAAASSSSAGPSLTAASLQG